MSLFGFGMADENLVSKYLKALENEANKRDKVCFIMDEIDEDEVQNPTLKDLQALRHVFVSRNADKIKNRLREACSMVGRDHWTDDIQMTGTSHGVEFQMIFRTELNFCQKLFDKHKYRLAGNVIVIYRYISKSILYPPFLYRIFEFCIFDFCIFDFCIASFNFFL